MNLNLGKSNFAALPDKFQKTNPYLDPKLIGAENINGQLFFNPITNTLFVKRSKQRDYVSISLLDITHIEADADYVHIYYGLGHSIMLLCTMKKIIGRFQALGYTQIYRSFIINGNLQWKKRGNRIWLEKSEKTPYIELPVGKEFNKKLKVFKIK